MASQLSLGFRVSVGGPRLTAALVLMDLPETAAGPGVPTETVEAPVKTPTELAEGIYGKSVHALLVTTCGLLT